MSLHRHWKAASAVLGLGIATAGWLAAVAAPSASDLQIQRGQEVYAQTCAGCHGAKLEGGASFPLAGAPFAARWTRGDRTFADFNHAVRLMPKQAPGSLSDADYAAVTSFILSANGYGPRSASTEDQVMQPPKAPVAANAPPPADLLAPPKSVASSQGSSPTPEELLKPADTDWLMYNRSYKGDRYAPLSQINVGNAGQLQPVCLLQLGVLGSFQSSPLVYKDTGYVSSTYGVFAFDPTTCERKWSYTYRPAGAEGFLTNRGMAIADGKLFRGTSDGHLIALDAASGKLLWDVHVADSAQGYGIGAAPVVYQGKVIVGLAGGDYGIPGHVYAFDARTGQLAWTFDTIHKAKWSKGAEYGGGATWTTVAVDVKDGLVFVPVGNPAPDFFLGSRPGDNLYSNSVVALKAGTGKVAWYVQQTAADFHDWDTAAPPLLYEQDGKRYLAVGTKAGVLHIYDRDSHREVARADVVERLNPDTPFTDKPIRVCPGPSGGVLWNGPAYDPNTKSVFVNSVQWCADYFTVPELEGKRPGAPYLEGGVKIDPPSAVTGWTRAFDAATGKPRWARKASKPMVGAVTPTAGGVVLTGGGDGRFLVLDQKDGRELYSFNLGGAVAGGVATYMQGGRQYVAVASGGFGIIPYGVVGSPTLAVFALPAPAR